MTERYGNFELHAPALVDLADHAHRNGLKTEAQVKADIALEFEAMDAMRLKSEWGEKRKQFLATGRAVIDLA
jgi:hypothetical protein